MSATVLQLRTRIASLTSRPATTAPVRPSGTTPNAQFMEHDRASLDGKHAGLVRDRHATGPTTPIAKAVILVVLALFLFFISSCTSFGALTAITPGFASTRPEMKFSRPAVVGSALLAASAASAQYQLGLGTGDVTGPPVEVSVGVGVVTARKEFKLLLAPAGCGDAHPTVAHTLIFYFDRSISWAMPLWDRYSIHFIKLFMSDSRY